MTLLNTTKEAARFGKKNTGSGVRQTWMNTLSLRYDHWQVTYFESCSLPVRWGKLVQDHFEN